MAAVFYSNLTLGIAATAVIAINQAVTAAGAVAGAGLNAIGTANTGAAIGERVPVSAGGTALAIAGAAIALGAAVEVGAAGKLITKAAGIAVGRAITAAAADGDQFEVFLIPN